MIYRLQPHPDSIGPPIAAIEVDATRRGDTLMLNYCLSGDIDAVAVPSASTPARRDELWQHTCCELFIADLSSNGYSEFNFSPSTEWAAYRFSGYRSGRATAHEVDAIRVSTRQSSDRLELVAAVPAPPQAMRIAVSAVVEARNGVKSYWALAHAPGKPDFHHAASFVDFRDETP